MRPKSIFLFACISIITALAGCSSSNQTEPKTAEERFAHGKKLYDEGDYFEAIQQFEILKLQFQGSSVSDQGQYYTGLARFEREEFILAEYDFELLVRNYPSSPLVPDAYFMIARCFVELSPSAQLDQSYTVRALDALQTFIELFPTHARVTEAQKAQEELRTRLAEKEYQTGELYQRLDDTKAALQYYDRVLDQFYNSPFADDALAAKIQILVRKKRFADATRAIETFKKKFPDSPLMSDVERAERNVSERKSAAK